MSKRNIIIDFSKALHNPKISETELDFAEINPNAIRVSQSSINTWRKCKKEYAYKFIEKIERRLPPAPLYKGSIIHEILEARINKQDWRALMEEHLTEYDKLFDEEKLEYGDLRNDLPIIMEGYDNLYKDEELIYFEKNGAKAEHSFSIPLDGKPPQETEIVFQGKMDAVAQDFNKRTWLVEHKTFSSLPDENFRFANQQALLYTWVMPYLGFPPATGILWDYIRSKVPTQPHVLKSGGLSKAKSIDTTHDVYLQAILENGLDPADYADILENLKGNTLKFYRRIYTPLRESMVYPVVKDLIETAKEIKMLHDVTEARNLGRHCSYCSFRNLCQAELQGFDTEMLRKREFRESTYHLNKEVKK